jgi:hypothetical protein
MNTERTRSPKEILDRLTPTHLQVPDVTEDLKEELTQKLDLDQKEAKPDPKAEKEYTFQIDYKGGNGKMWKGAFRNRILSIRDRQVVGVMRARLCGGLPQESLDPLTREINLMVSHLAFSLVEKPAWAEELRDLDDVRLLQAIYEEVLSHEASFHGYGNGPV